jgi:hypothetical protein
MVIHHQKLVVRLKNICHGRTINDYIEINHVSSESKDDVLKRRTSNNKSDGTFDNTEKCALNFEIDEEKTLTSMLRMLAG